MIILLVSINTPLSDMVLIKRVLAIHDIQMKRISSYKEAIEDIAKYKYAIVILYCNEKQNDLKATEAVRIMKKVSPSILIITISEDTPIDTERELRQSGLYFHLTSPIDEKEFEEVILSAVKKKSMEKNR